MSDYPRLHFLPVISGDQTEFVAYRRISFCRIDPEQKTVFFKFTSGAHTFIRDVQNMPEVANALKEAAIPETDHPEPHRHVPRRKRKAMKTLDPESVQAGKMELLLEIHQNKRRELGLA